MDLAKNGKVNDCDGKDTDWHMTGGSEGKLGSGLFFFLFFFRCFFRFFLVFQFSGVFVGWMGCSGTKTPCWVMQACGTVIVQ